MPGYGYAKIPRSESRRFTRMFELYLAESRRNALVQLIDARHEPSELDLESVRRLDATGPAHVPRVYQGGQGERSRP